LGNRRWAYVKALHFCKSMHGAFIYVLLVAIFVSNCQNFFLPYWVHAFADNMR
jgi:hypothetical protein